MMPKFTTDPKMHLDLMSFDINNEYTYSPKDPDPPLDLRSILMRSGSKRGTLENLNEVNEIKGISTIYIYQKKLKSFARKLRSNMTKQEELLWSFLRKKQIKNIQFFRQKPLGKYIVDFYAHSVKLIIEIDGSQHSEPQMAKRDCCRDNFFKKQGLSVIRFDNGHVEMGLDLVLHEIDTYIQKYLSS